MVKAENRMETQTVRIPSQEDPNQPFTLTSQKGESIIIIGENGSGKTAFAGKIYQFNHDRAIFIEANRILSISPAIQDMSHDMARNLLNKVLRNRDRTNKFQNVLTYLLSEYVSEAIKAQNAKDSGLEYVASLTKTKQVKDIWNQLFPTKSLEINPIRKDFTIIRTELPWGTDERIFPDALSDGEKALLHSIAICMCAEENSILIVDEPELHLHKRLLNSFWDLMEKQRQDCQFIYVTNDIEFTESRKSSHIIVINDYRGREWDFQILPSSREIAENLLLRLLGNRQPILLVEGTNTSLDIKIYKNLFVDYYVIPHGSCERIIQTAQAFNEQNRWHHKLVKGLIDRDYRTDMEIANLKSRNIYCLRVSEVEYLLCTKQVIFAVAQHLKMNPQEVFVEVKSKVIKFLKSKLELEILRRTKEMLIVRIKDFEPEKIKSVGDLENIYNNHINSINLKAIESENRDLYEKILAEADYEGILCNFKNEGILASVASVFHMYPQNYQSLALGLVIDNDYSLKVELRKYINID